MEANDKIQSIIDSHDIVLFMKGDQEEPRCGFSAQAIHLLASYRRPFHTVDVLEDPDLRAGLKTFSQWPTFPQLYVKKSFIGGIDIMRQMYDSGEFSQLMHQASVDEQA